MIEFTKSYKTADGQVFGSITDAQVHDLASLIQTGGTTTLNNPESVSNFLLANKDMVVDILTTTPNSKPKARTTHGGSKKRTPKTIVTDADPSVTVASTNQAT